MVIIEILWTKRRLQVRMMFCDRWRTCISEMGSFYQTEIIGVFVGYTVNVFQTLFVIFLGYILLTRSTFQIAQTITWTRASHCARSDQRAHHHVTLCPPSMRTRPNNCVEGTPTLSSNILYKSCYLVECVCYLFVLVLLSV